MVNKIKVVMAMCAFFFVVLFVLAKLSPETLSFDLEFAAFSSTQPGHDRHPSLIVEEPLDEDDEDTLTLRAKYGPVHHSNSSSCFSAKLASLYPTPNASITSLSQCGTWWNPNGQKTVQSTWECQENEETEFGQLCYFENACFANNTIFLMLNLDNYQSFRPFTIFPGVGHVRRNNVSSIEVIGVVPGAVENWLEAYSPCLISKPTFIFARIYTNFFYTTYTAAALDTLLRSVDPNYPRNLTGDRVVILTDKAGVRDTATGFFEMFSPYHYADTKMVSMNNDPEHRPLCFRQAYVGLSSGNVVQGDDIKAFLKHKYDTLRKKYGVKGAAVLKACTMGKMTDSEDYDPAIEDDQSEEAQDSDVQEVEMNQTLAYNETDEAIELENTKPATQELASPSITYDAAGYPNSDEYQSSLDPNGEDGVEKKKKKRGGEVEIRKIVAECETTKALTRANLKEFSRLLLYKHDLSVRKSPDVLKVTFISRANNRRVLNEVELIEKIKTRYGEDVPIEVNLVRLEKLSFHDQLELIRNTNILVGMHGAAWVHLLWLDPDRSAAIELFPYQVNKGTYLILANLLGLDFYQWRNEDPTKAVFNWDIVARHNLTIAEKDELVREGTVRGWSSLYARYFFKNADTIVDEDQFFALFDNVIAEVSAKLQITEESAQEGEEDG